MTKTEQLKAVADRLSDEQIDTLLLPTLMLWKPRLPPIA
jgi:hypothetical protein